MQDKDIYKVIADELATKKADPALWTQAIAMAEGDADKTQAAYIRLRFADLRKAAAAPAAAAQDASRPPAIPNAADARLSRMRSELERRLRTQGKPSLYSTLSLHADASDAVVSSAIADVEARAEAGTGVTPAEFKYAKETLGDPALREQYDRNLLESLLGDEPSQVRPLAYEPAGNDHSWWESRKTSVIIGVLSITLLGYLGLGFFKARGGHEIQKEALDVQRSLVTTVQQQTQSAMELKSQAVQAEIDQRNRSLSLIEERQRQEADMRVRIAEQQIDQQRREQERRDEMLKMQQQQAENVRIQREKQYWACMNQQLGLRDVSSYDASARCSMYR